MAKNAKRTRVSSKSIIKEAKLSDKFIYRCETYKVWSKGACLISTRYYKSNNPLDLKKIPTILKRKNYNLIRFIKLIAAPEEYLNANGYIAIK